MQNYTFLPTWQNKPSSQSTKSTVERIEKHIIEHYFIMICNKLAIIFISQHSNPNKFCIFASAYKSNVSRKQEKHCDIVLYLEFAKIHTGGLSIFAFACCVCNWFSRQRHIFRREICSLNPVPVKVFGDTSDKTDMST